ncbi:hypothetical protein PNEG_02943 [Pneumocystis murina B123]|uniref:HIG1 domain-containing protein n=1 Tax=Pneumocystis murina (strain B123) TaxID=1069680 RepID=M7NJK1_PNEMU|nr:hypothetical protein PNEG_02943 [Pneumocystis murina B123]EMR08773.1 hypothetical protein PNEG_02943 [Pneumocystis murina B123]
MSTASQNTEKNNWKKIIEKFKKEPLVPIGMVATCLALFSAAIAIQQNNKRLANRMFRYRVYAQGFTIISMIVGSIYYRHLNSSIL